MKVIVFLLLPLLFIASALPGGESAFALDRVGFRAGFGDERAEDFTSFEILALADTPWEWTLADRIELEIELEGALGMLDSGNDTAATVHLGFAASLAFEDFPLILVGGSGPTLITEDSFGDFDLGGNLHFTSSAGLDLEIGGDWKIGYRYQHISNANLDDPNPGLNLHAVSAVYDF